MFIADTLLGNLVADTELAYRVQAMEKAGAVARVAISASEAQRRRMRLTSETGVDVGIVAEGNAPLKNGDVLSHAGDESQLVVVEVAPAEAMAIRMVPRPADEASFAAGVLLGHMLGNQHWPITVEGAAVLTPVSIDRHVMEAVVRTHGFPGLEWEYIGVDPGRVPTGMPRIAHDHG